MKQFSLLVCCLLIWAAGIAQSKPKKEAPPTQKQMDDMMKQAQEAMRNMDPETKKMLDSMGIKLPSVKSAPNVGDKQLAQAWEEQMMTVPKKDADRIAIANKTSLADAAVPAYIQRVHVAVASKISAQSKSTAEQVYQNAKNDKSNVAGSATGLWLQGQADMATYLMGKAANDDAANADNLNNYSAFLTMTGAEEAALPLLMNLNKRFPKNSTILNNIGQAWFGLGELDKSMKYLDSAILIYALHPQANYTKCLVLESKGGDPVKAIEALKKSIAGAYSKEKESKLRDMGYELESKDVNWDFPIPVDALGLQRFFTPKYPMNAEQSAALDVAWKAFKKECNEKIQELKAKNEKLQEEIQQQAMDVQKEMMSAVMNKRRLAQPVLIPFYHAKAMKKLMYLIDDKDGSEAYNRQRIGKEQENVFKQVDQVREKMNKEQNELDKKLGGPGGEGGGGISSAEYCRQMNAVVNKYLPVANKLLFDIRVQHLELTRKTLNNQAYFNLFTMDALTFEYWKNGAKINWLTQLSGSRVEFWRCNTGAPQDEKNIAASKILPDFDDIHCDRHVKFYFFSTTLKLDCSRLTSEINLPVLKASVKENLNSNELIRGTLEVGYFRGAGVDVGPVKGEFKAEAGVTVEFDKSGVTDVGVRGKAMAGDEIGGIAARYGWNSGGSLSGKGILRGINLK